MNKILNILICLSVLMSSLSCTTQEKKFGTTNDVADAKLAFLADNVSQKDMETLFPDAESKEFLSATDMLVALSASSYDACVVSSSLADDILTKLEDYEQLNPSNLTCDSVKVLVHKSKSAVVYKVDNEPKGFIDQAVERVRSSLLAGEYWKMILSGLLITVIIFTSAWLFAMVVAVFMTLLGFVRSLRYLWKALMLFIQTIHDVPSVVLIFFFYYVVFAGADCNPVYACIVALGVYASGSFSKVIATHLKEVDPTQHRAAEMLGLKGWKKYRLVILPQAVRPMIPFLVSESKVLLRATTYAGYVAILDIVKVTELIRKETGDTLVPMIFVSIVFLILSWMIRKGIDLLYKKMFVND